MLKFHFYFSLFFLSASLFAQNISLVWKAEEWTPEIDGLADLGWTSENPFFITKAYQDEHPSLGAAGETFWKSVWNEDGIYFFIHIRDSVFSPGYNDSDWQLYDGPELYFDCNDDFIDGLGPESGQGHYRVSFRYNQSKLHGEQQEVGNGIRFAHLVTDSTAQWEFFIPWSVLLDREGGDLLWAVPHRFDMTIRDNDTPGIPGVQRAVWVNDGTGEHCHDESWMCMDDCGIILLAQSCSCPAPTQSIDIYVDADEILTDNGTLQCNAIVNPERALQKVKWSVQNESGKAVIDQTGLLEARMNGKVRVIATARDGMPVHSEKEIDIKNQSVTLDDINIIQNGSFSIFENDMIKDWFYWNTDTVSFVDGMLVCTNDKRENRWSLTVMQKALDAGWTLYNDTSYLLMLDAWADLNRKMSMDFEDTENGYWRLGYSEDSNSLANYSEWTIDLRPIVTHYEQHFTVNVMKENSYVLFNLFFGEDGGTAFVDNVGLFTTGDYAVYLANLNGVKQNSSSSFKIFPNPSSSLIHITLRESNGNEKFQIIDLVGRILMEGQLEGKETTIPVSNLQPAVYLLRMEESGKTKTVLRFMKSPN